LKLVNKQLILFIIGICGGILLAGLIKSELLSGTELLGENALLQVRYAEIHSKSLFLRLLGQRLGEALLLILLSTTFLGMAAAWFAAPVGLAWQDMVCCLVYVVVMAADLLDLYWSCKAGGSDGGSGGHV
jgi:hypothetical protein